MNYKLWLRNITTDLYPRISDLTESQINAKLEKREEIGTFWFANFTSTSNPGAPISILMLVGFFIFTFNTALRSVPLLSQMSRS